MAKRRTRPRPRPADLSGLERELRREWAGEREMPGCPSVCCGECRFRGPATGECTNPESVKAGIMCCRVRAARGGGWDKRFLQPNAKKGAYEICWNRR